MPFVFFENSSMEECENVFINTMGHRVFKTWTENYDDDYELWESIKSNINKVMRPENCEVYVYNPHVNADPLQSYHNAIAVAMSRIRQQQAKRGRRGGRGQGKSRE